MLKKYVNTLFLSLEMRIWSTGSNPVCSIVESTWNRDFSVYTNYETCEWLRPFAFVVYGKMYRFALCEAAPLIIWHGKLQHGWGRFTTILPSRHS